MKNSHHTTQDTKASTLDALLKENKPAEAAKQAEPTEVLVAGSQVIQVPFAKRPEDILPMVRHAKAMGLSYIEAEPHVLQYMTGDEKCVSLCYTDMMVFAPGEAAKHEKVMKQTINDKLFPQG